MGVTTLELNEYAKSHPEIDSMIDGETQRVAAETHRAVFDSRMAWHFVPTGIDVYLYVAAEIAAKRVLADGKRVSEPLSGEDHALAQLQARRRSEVERFKGLYGVDCSALANFDLVVDTSWIPAVRAAELVARRVRGDDGAARADAYLSPRSLYPTDSVRSLSGERYRSVVDSVARRGFDETQPVSVMEVEHRFFVLDGHLRTSACLRADVDVVPCVLAAAGDRASYLGVPAKRFVSAEVRRSEIHDWEDCHGFRFPSYPEFVR